MPFTCSVPNCKGNYRTGEKVHVFSFPKNEDLKTKWIRAIKRENFVPTKNSRVCHHHFKASDIRWTSTAFDEKNAKEIIVNLKIPKLTSDAVPSLMPNCPHYMSSSNSKQSSRLSPQTKRRLLEQEGLSKAIESSIRDKQQFDAEREFSCLTDLLSRIKLLHLSGFWNLAEKDNCVVIFNMKFDPTPQITRSIVINEEMVLTAFIENVALGTLGKNFKMPMPINNICVLNSILDELESVGMPFKANNIETTLMAAQNILSTITCNNIESENTIKFIVQQISLLIMKKPRYTPEIMVFASLCFYISPHVYNFQRKSSYILLPHPNTIRHISLTYNVGPQKEQTSSNFLMYIQHKFHALTEADKKVILLVDEIHIKPFFDYKGGNVVGMSFDSINAASSAHTFMISSIMSQYKDVVHLLPVKKLTADVLHSFIQKIIIGLESIGFFVIGVVTDNNAINRKAVSYFSTPSKVQIVYPHPVDHTRPLFFLIDSVHLIKCVRNNWLCQRNIEKCMYFPKFGTVECNQGINAKEFLSASFNTLKDLHREEMHSLLKYGHNLSFKALAPSNLEKQNVRLVLQVFNEFVAQALLSVDEGKLSHSKHTAEYINIMVKWFSIMNVKSPYKGKCLNDKLKEPLTNEDKDEKVIFLNTFLHWLDSWEAMGCTTGMLSKETHSALKLTTHSILEVASYCICELGMNYILPGKFQTDNLEAHFSLYRQLAGGQYNVSTRQIFEIEEKLRMQSLMSLKLKTKTFGNIEIKYLDAKEDFNAMEELLNECVHFNVVVTKEDISGVQKYMPVIAYLGGYCVHTVMKKIQCTLCKDLFVLDKEIALNENYNFIKNLDRGKLLCPKKHVINAILYNYIVVQKLCSDFENKFLKIKNQRQTAFSITFNLLVMEELLNEQDSCEEGHCFETIFKKIIWSSTNALLNNYCKKKNDLLVAVSCKKKADALTRKRKLETLGNV